MLLCLLYLNDLRLVRGLWPLGLYDLLRNDNDIILNGFESAGIMQAAFKELPNKQLGDYMR